MKKLLLAFLSALVLLSLGMAASAEGDYTIMLDYNGGSGSGSVSSIQSNENLPSADGVTGPGGQGSGYTLSKWIIDGAEYAPGAIPDDVTKSTTAYAVWHRTVNWMNNGAAYVSATEQIYNPNDPNAEPASPSGTPTKTHETNGYQYVFTGWSAGTPSGSGVTYTAQYKEQVLVTYNAGGGTGTMDPVWVDKGTNYNLAINTFGAPTSPVQYEFDTWMVSGSAVSSPITVNAPTTVTAKWKHTVILNRDNNDDGNQLQISESTVYYPDGEPPKSTPSKTGVSGKYDYVFVEWSDGVVSDATTTYTAKFNKKFTVSFEANGGTDSQAQQELYYNYNDDSPQYPTLTLPTRADCTITAPTSKRLVGWTSSVGGTTPNKPGDTVNITQNTTFTAQWDYIPSFTLNFNANEGTGSMERQSHYVDIGFNLPTAEDAAVFTSPSDSMSFAGWTVLDKMYSPGASCTVSEDEATANGSMITAIAQWVRTETVTLTIKPGDSSKVVEISERSQPIFTGAYTLPPCPFTAKTGYTFAGWKFNGGDIYDAGGEVTISGHSVIEAQWEAATYTVTLDANGGTIGGADTKSIDRVYNGDNVDFAEYEPERVGYTFAGWFTEREAGTQVLSVPKEDTTETLTYYAHWTLVSHTITLDPDGGTVSADWLEKNGWGASNTKTYDVTSGEIALPPAANVTRDGYTFLGWKLYAGEEGTVGEYVSAHPAGSVGEAVYKAEWSPVEYTVILDINGGTFTRVGLLNLNLLNLNGNGWTQILSDEKLYARRYTPEDVIPLPGTEYLDPYTGESLPELERPGYVFNGWSVWRGGEGVLAETDEINGLWGDITLKANWELIEYDVTFELDEGELDEYDTFSYNTRDGLTLPGTIPDGNNLGEEIQQIFRLGYRFDGWFRLDPETNLPTGEAVTKIEPGETGDQTFQAVWTKLTYILTLDPNGGAFADNGSTDPRGFSYTIDEPEEIDYSPMTEDEIDPLPGEEEMIRPGYAFVGWFEYDSEGELVAAQEVDIGTSTGNKYFIAQWVPLEDLTAILDYNYLEEGAEESRKDVVTFVFGQEEDIDLPTEEDMDRTGYAFQGWYLVPNPGDEDQPVTQLNTHTAVVVTYYAKWEPVYWTVQWLDGNGAVLDSVQFLDGSEEPPTTQKIPTPYPRTYTEDETVYYRFFVSWDGPTTDEEKLLIIYQPVFEDREELQECTVEFYPNYDEDYQGDSAFGDIESVTMQEWGLLTLPQNAFDVPEGQRFEGWLVNGVLCQPGETVTIYGNTWVYAQWHTLELYTVTLVIPVECTVNFPEESEWELVQEEEEEETDEDEEAEESDEDEEDEEGGNETPVISPYVRYQAQYLEDSTLALPGTSVLSWNAAEDEDVETVSAENELAKVFLGWSETESMSGKTVSQASGGDKTYYALCARKAFVQYRSLVLDGNVTIRLYLVLPQELFDRSETRPSYALTYSGSVNTSTIGEDLTASKTYTDAYEFTCQQSVAAKEMRDSILLRVLDGDGNRYPLYHCQEYETDGGWETRQVDDTQSGFQYSVQNYFNDANTKQTLIENYDKLSPLLESMSDYGKYAQVYFDHNAGDATEIHYPADIAAVSKTSVSSHASKVVSKSIHGLDQVGYSLILESATTLRVYYRLGAGKTLDAFRFTVTDSKGAQVSSNFGYDSKQSAYYLEVRDIPAKDLNKRYTFKATNVDTGAFTEIQCSALSYVYTALGQSNTKLLNLVRSLYLYHQRAAAYFG